LKIPPMEHSKDPFDNDKLIKMEDRSGEPSGDPDQEKKMYEARLPLEISELFDILKKK
jgi:hypothetical protein